MPTWRSCAHRGNVLSDEGGHHGAYTITTARQRLTLGPTSTEPGKSQFNWLFPFPSNLPISRGLSRLQRMLPSCPFGGLAPSAATCLSDERGTTMPTQSPRPTHRSPLAQQAPDARLATSIPPFRSSSNLLISRGLSRLQRILLSCPLGGLALFGAMCSPARGDFMVSDPSPRKQRGAAPAGSCNYGY